MQTQLHSGDRIGDWVVVEALGSGGMGSVYRCHSALTQQVQAAIKILNVAGAKDAKARFVREIEVLASLDHPNIVRVLGGGEDATTGALYLVMELVPGKDLTWYIEGRALPWADACRIVRDVASGLAEAHSKGVHHRDLKPANIMLGDDGRVKLIDFGIALADGQTRLTRHQGIPGTMSYMPPEVFTQGRSHDPALGDVYSLGLCLYEALVGFRAYPESPELTTVQRFAEVMGAKSRDPFLDPGDTFPDGVRELVKAATRKNPAERIQDAAAMAEALHGLIEDHVPTRAFTPAPAPRRPKSTEETFTLDADPHPEGAPPTMAPPPPPKKKKAPAESPAVKSDTAQPRARVRRSAPTTEQQAPVRGIFPGLSLAASSALAVAPPLWTGLVFLIAPFSAEVAGVLLAFTLLLAPVGLPVVALVGMVFTAWFVARVGSRSRYPLIWYLVAGLLTVVHIWHIALAVVNTALIAALTQIAAEQQAQPDMNDFFSF